MNVEYTGRQYEITPAIRKEVETGLTKIKKILGDKFDTKVILAVEKHRHKAEITVSPRNGPIVGLAQASDMLSAVNEALEHLEKQAVKYKTRWRTKKRQPHKGWDGEGKQVATSGLEPSRKRTFARPPYCQKERERAGVQPQGRGHENQSSYGGK